MKNPYIKATEKAIIQDTFTGYEVSWKCNNGHINFQTIITNGLQYDVCLKCGKHYEYQIEKL